MSKVFINDGESVMKPKIHSIKYNFIMNIILKLSTVIFPLITFPYVSRILLAEGNGKIAFATSIISYFSMFAVLGVSTHGVKVCAQCRDDKEELSRTVQELLIINGISTIIVYLAFVISLVTIKQFQEEKILLLINSCSILLNVLGVEWFYQAIEQYDYITFRNLAFKFIALILMFLFVHDTSDYIIYGAINVVGTSGSYLLNVINLRRYVTLKPLGKYNFKRHIKPIFIFFALTVASNVYTNLDTVMLKFISGDAMTGYYNAAVKIKSVLMSIVTALSGVMIPRMSYYIYNKMFREFKAIVQRAMQFTLVLAIPFSFYFIEEATAAITLLSSEKYLPAVTPMQIITPTIIFIGISQVTGMQVLIPLEKGHYTAISTVIGAVVDFILNLFLIPRYGASGAAFATLIAEIVVAGTQLVCLRNEKIQFFDKKDMIKIIMACLAALFCLKWVKRYLIVGSFIELVITSIVFFGVYSLLLLILKESIIELYIKPNIRNIMLKIKMKGDTKNV